MSTDSSFIGAASTGEKTLGCTLMQRSPGRPPGRGVGEPPGQVTYAPYGTQMFLTWV